MHEEASIKHLTSYVSLKTRQATNYTCKWSQTKGPASHTNKLKPVKGRKETTFSTQIALHQSSNAGCVKDCTI